MIILFSPTKQMDFESPLSPEFQNYEKEWDEPVFKDRASAMNSLLADLDREELKALMKISPVLTEKTMKVVSSFVEARKRPALAAYSGTAFKFLDSSSLSADSLSFARKHLRILSGMYGLLGPFDLIAPYRLEMKTPLAVPGASSLGAYWKPLVSALLEGEDFILNLASAEYSRIISVPKKRVVDIQFKEEKGDKLRTVGMYAKQARGLMLRMILERRLTDLDSIRSLSPGGYSFREELSHQYSWVYTRPVAE